MQRSPTRFHEAAQRGTLALLAMLILGLAACPKPKPPPQEVDDRPERPAIEIVSIHPIRTTVGTAVTVSVEGRGFKVGSEVYLGSRKARGVDVIDDSELTFRATEDLPLGTYDVRVVTPKGDQAVRADGFRVVEAKNRGDCTLQTVRFEFNEFSLDSSARQILADNARCVEERKLSGLRLEGHADERGSTEYNLSLGQRRAESVKSYLSNLGISPSAMTTVSYGEERPVSNGSGESAWAQNRRVEFVVR